jgi:hypothetical protein
MRLVLAALALVVVGVLGTGIVAAQPPVIDLNTIIVDVLETPAFAIAYGDAEADARWNMDDARLGKLAPYTVAQVLVYDPTGATNTWVDPTSAVNLTAISISGLGQGGITNADIKDGSQEWQSYAAAAAMAQGETDGLRHAWTVGYVDVDSEVQPDFSTADAMGLVVGISDFPLL